MEAASAQLKWPAARATCCPGRQRPATSSHYGMLHDVTPRYIIMHAPCRLEEEQGVVIRFVVGHSQDAAKEAAMNEEEAVHGGFWRLPVQVRLGSRVGGWLGTAHGYYPILGYYLVMRGLAG